jgi:hypothetical protein
LTRTITRIVFSFLSLRRRTRRAEIDIGPEKEFSGYDTRVSRVLPHEIVAAVFLIVGLVLLERMPVTYPRTALFLAYAMPGLVIFGLAASVSFFRLRGRREVWKRDLIDIARCCLVLMLVFSMSFLLKSFIYLLNHRELFKFDRALHFGHSPTIFLVTLLRNPLLLRVLDFYYTGFYFFMFIGVPSFLLAYLDRRGRFRFIAALVLMWIAGNVLYIVLPSWGPAFSDTRLVVDALQYMPRTVRVQTALYQELSSLVRSPLAPRNVRYGSVAAFPSLHVGIITLFALATRKLLPAGFALLIVAILLMQIGSVVTGYHFMIDGYAGMLLAAGSWFAARWSSGPHEG